MNLLIGIIIILLIITFGFLLFLFFMMKLMKSEEKEMPRYYGYEGIDYRVGGEKWDLKEN